ncbi:hypothetical protein GCM10007866_16310 [Gluconobacter albidus]|uniref:Uncharacterized protein n=1 Tax=Gluconobacter albidus TaxID=318683 RepID=A0ABQ5X037_9PROT|nr:hypothetical protein GCM10007866_16310 [Gluconobacter albidus]
MRTIAHSSSAKMRTINKKALLSPDLCQFSGSGALVWALARHSGVEAEEAEQVAVDKA